MAREARIILREELERLGLPAPCDRLEIHVCMAELERLKRHYREHGRTSRVVFSNSEELLVRLPTCANVVWHHGPYQGVEILYYGPMKGVDYV